MQALQRVSAPVYVVSHHGKTFPVLVETQQLSGLLIL